MEKEKEILKFITKESPQETKERVHKEFAQRMLDYQAKKQKEVASRKAKSLIKTSTFKLSESDQLQLKEVSGMLGITPSQFIRESIIEACMVLQATPQQLQAATNKLTQTLKK